MIQNYKTIIMKYLSALTLALFFSLTCVAQQTLAEKLGYDADAKLLIIHADDLGVSHSENTASIKAMEEGSVSSASIMMPTPWVTEIAAYAREHKDTHDLGLHLTLTAEWETYKWGPVASKDKVLSLLTESGNFPDNCTPNPNIDEVEIELRAQIDLAFELGINPTHLDSHMGCSTRGAEILAIYLKLGKEYGIPCLIHANQFSEEQLSEMKLDNQNLVVVDAGFSAGTSDFDIENGMAARYTAILKSMKPGLNRITAHIAYDNDEMKAITVNKKYYGANWRQQDFDFFASDECKKIIEEENIKLITWREISLALKSN